MYQPARTRLLTPMRNTDLILDGGSDLTDLIGLAGAVAGLAEEYSFHRVAGTGAGAVVAALVTAGLTDRLERLVLDDSGAPSKALHTWLSAKSGVPARLPDDLFEGSALRVRRTVPLTPGVANAPVLIEAPEVLTRTVYVDIPDTRAHDRGLLFDDGLRAAAYFLCDRENDPARR